MFLHFSLTEFLKYTTSAQMQKEANLVYLVALLKKKSKHILLVTFLFFFLSYVVCKMMTPLYKATVVILPLGQSGSLSLAAMAAQLSGISMLGGLGVGPTGQSPSGTLMAFLNSQTVAENVINRFELLPVFFHKKWDAGHKKWNEEKGRIPTLHDGVGYFKKYVLDVELDTDTGVLDIYIYLPDPNMAAQIANGLLDELSRFINNNAFSEAKKNRLFIEDQLKQNERALLESGKDLSEYYQIKSVSAVSPQVDIDINASFPLQANSALSLKALQEEVDKTKDQLGVIDKKIEEKNIVHNIPQQVYLEYIMLRKETLTKLNALLNSQYEMAKIEEAKESVSFQIIDSARVPEGKDKPKTLLVIVISGMIGFFGAVFFVFFKEYWNSLKDVS